MNKRFLIIISTFLWCLSLFSQTCWDEYDCLECGDSYLKGNKGKEKNVDKAVVQYTMAADMGSYSAYEKLKKLEKKKGIKIKDRLELAVHEHGYNVTDSKDSHVKLIEFAKGYNAKNTIENYENAIAQALKQLVEDPIPYSGKSGTIKEYEVFFAMNYKDTIYVAVEAVIDLPHKNSQDVIFKETTYKEKYMLKDANAVKCASFYFNLFNSIMPYCIDANLELQRTDEPPVRGIISFTRNLGASALSHLTNCLFSRLALTEGELKYRLTLTERELKYHTITLRLNKDGAENKYIIIYEALQALGDLNSPYPLGIRYNIFFPDYVIVTNMSTRLVDINGLNMKPMFYYDKETAWLYNCPYKIGEQEIEIPFTREEFANANKIEIKKLNEISFGQQMQVLEGFNFQYNHIFWNIYNKIYRWNQGKEERIMALNQLREKAECNIKGEDKYNKYRKEIIDDLGWIESNMSNAIDRSNRGIKKMSNAVKRRYCNKIIEKCNEGIFLLEDARDLFTCSGNNEKANKCGIGIDYLNGIKKMYQDNLKLFK